MFADSFQMLSHRNARNLQTKSAGFIDLSMVVSLEWQAIECSGNYWLSYSYIFLVDAQDSLLWMVDLVILISFTDLCGNLQGACKCYIRLAGGASSGGL